MTKLELDWHRYQIALPRWKEAAESARREVIRIARSAGIPADVSAREKTLAEFARKAIRKRYSDPWTQITDKAGTRAVVERNTHVDSLLAAIIADARLTVVDGSIEDKRDIDPARLEYAGVHCTVIPPDPASDTDVLTP